MRGEILPGQSSEWAITRLDGSVKADVRLLLRTDDGAPVLMTYNGVGTLENGELRVRAAPLLEAGDERYAWLNRIQAISFGTPIDGGIRYEVFRLL